MSSFQLKSGEAVIIRSAILSDVSSMASIAYRAYFNDPSEVFRAPKRHQYLQEYERNFRQRIRARFLNPRALSIVAVLASAPSHPIACAQFVRVGDDAPALRQIASRDTYRLRGLAWYYWAENHITNHFWPDRSTDPKAVQESNGWRVQDDEKYWNSAERANRWHALNVVVAPEWQGKGVGKLLMGGILERAREEGVIVGMEANSAGERLYGALGFRLLGRFCKTPEGMRGGGVMLYEPTSASC